jgi:hypothetical protein
VIPEVNSVGHEMQMKENVVVQNRKKEKNPVAAEAFVRQILIVTIMNLFRERQTVPM